MFPRRRTDQVYATLQQVQRRITEQGGGQTASVSTPAGMTAPTGRTPVAGTPTPGAMPVIRPGPQIQPQAAYPQAPPLLPPGVGTHQRYSVVLSGTLASLLAVCWLATLAAAILITKHVVRPGSAPTGEAAPRTAVSNAPVAQPKWKMIVLAEMRANAESRSRLAKERDTLNEVAKRNSWPALFEIEEGVNGGVQLVFGPQGVDKNQWIDFTSKLLKRHVGASWVELR